MALGTLGILYIVLVIVAVIIQVLLYKNKAKNSIFIINMIFSLILSYISYTSFPINFTGQRIFAIVLAIIAVLAVLLKLNNAKLIMVSKVMLTLSILGSFLQLFL